MSDQLVLPGAYYIRNKKTSTVLHTDKVYFDGESRVLAYNQEVKYGNQQIWWIEPLPDYADMTEPTYFITNPGSGRALDVMPGESPDKAYGIFAANHHGESWQRWKIKRVGGDEGDAYYSITNIFSGFVLAVQDDHVELHSQKYVPGNDQHCWEFVIPTVSFPPGWFQIQNAGSGELLSHTYSWNPPVLQPPPSSPQPPQYRESYQFQWTLAHSWCYHLGVGPDINSWRIINRLTRNSLCSQFTPYTPGTIRHHNQDLDWELELDPSYNWKIRNRSNSCYLAQSIAPPDSGTTVVCNEKRFTRGGSKSWVLRPMRPMDDASPPEYKTLEG